MPASHIAWAGVLLSSFALAAPFVETKDVVKVDANQKKDIIIEAGSGDVNIYINQVVATTTVAATTVTVPGCGGATPVTATQIAATPYTVANTVPAGTNPSALPKPGTYNAGSTSWSAEQGPYDGKEPEAVLHPVDPKLPAYAHPSACAPQPAATLYYGQSTTAPGQPVASAAILEIPSLNYPAVNAHLAEAITSVVCRGGSATVTFSNTAAYDVAVNTWTQPLTLISYSDSCGTGKDGTHDFILIQKVNKGPSGSLTLECAITIIDFEEAVGADTEMTCTIGAHKPGGHGNNGTIPGTKPGTNGTIPGGNGNINGTTATCLAAGFDEALDEAKGDDINIADPAVWSKVAPGTSAEDWGGDFETDDLPDVDENETRARRRKRSLRRRTALRSRDAALKKRGLKDYLKKKYNNFAKNNPIVRLPTTDEVGDFLERKARQALGVLNDWTSVNKDLSSDLSFNRYPTNGQSPFNDNAAGYKFYDNGDLEAWCVGCGADSTLRTTGKITFSIAKGFTNGNVRLFGGFNAGLNVGLIGKVAKNIPIAETTFVQVTLGDVLLPGILKLGPSVRVGAGSFVVFEATGQLYTGVNAKWPNVDISLDALNIGASYANGLTPEITTKFETKGEISITVDTHLTLAVGLTIGILNDKFTRSVEVIDQPGLQVTAGIQGSASFNGGFSAGFEGECRGISLAAKVYNNVTADILKLTQRQLFQWTSPTVSRCFTIGGSEPTTPQPSNTPTTPDDPSTTPTTPDDPSTTPTDPDTPAAPGGGDSAAPAPEGKRRRSLKKSARAPKVSDRKGSAYLAPRQVAPSNATGDVFLNNTRTSKENEGESFTPMASNDGFFELHWSSEGNIYVLPSNEDTDSVGAAADDTSINSADETGLFGTIQVDNSTAKIIVGDSDGRLFSAYSDEFAKYGVSRIRLHEPDFLPATALSVVFGDANDSNTQGTDSDALVASDTEENIYYPVVCVYDECYPKLFLVKDPYDGPGLLKNLPELTGQDNLDCGFLPLVPQIY